jgi:hypothetical protein
MSEQQQPEDDRSMEESIQRGLEQASRGETVSLDEVFPEGLDED